MASEKKKEIDARQVTDEKHLTEKLEGTKARLVIPFLLVLPATLEYDGETMTFTVAQGRIEYHKDLPEQAVNLIRFNTGTMILETLKTALVNVRHYLDKLNAVVKSTQT